MFVKKPPKDEFMCLVRINYRSGIQEEFWCLDFNYGPGKGLTGPTYNWTLSDPPCSWADNYLPNDGAAAPIHIGPDDIESAWIVRKIKMEQGKENNK